MSETNEKLKSLIEDYKILITKTHLEDEIYKWQIAQKYQGRPDVNAPDFYQEIKSINLQNLTFMFSGGVLRHVAKEKPEELRMLFKNLFDESIDLGKRIISFQKEISLLYKELNNKPHHQDERAIAAYLTIHNPEKYTFYKASFYTQYCKLLGIPVAAKNKKYIHYLQLLKDFIAEYIEPDRELIESVKSYIPKYYDGSNNLLLAQDILYNMLDKKNETSYWVFQANPKYYDIFSALKDNAVNSWTVTAHKDKIKKGHKVIIWVTGDKPGCYALGETTSEVYKPVDDAENDKYFKRIWRKESSYEIDIKITHNFVQQPITKELVNSEKTLSDLKAGLPGTNFQATREQYETLLGMAETGNLTTYDQIKKNLDQEKLHKYFSIIRQYVQKKEITQEDERVSFNLRPYKNGLVFLIGRRYVFEIYSIGNKTLYSFISSEKLNDFSEPFTNNKKIEAYWNRTEDIEPFEEKMVESFNIELSRNYKCPYRKFNNQYFMEDIFQTEISKAPSPVRRNFSKPLESLNTILYGPPGTGKTYYLKQVLMDRFTSKQNSVTKEDYQKETIQSLSWWQVIALAIMDLGVTKVADIKAHQYIQFKKQISNSIDINPILWAQLQVHTVDDCEFVNVQKRYPPYIFNKTQDAKWEVVEENVQEQYPELIDMKTKLENFEKEPDKKIERFEFLTFHQSYSYEDFVEGLKPELSDNDIAYTIEEGIFKRMCNKALNDPDNNYAIFIDEISRGNVSAIFGELITLIEEDKRRGMPNEISVILPYSKKPFTVPSNLYIVGTMNTADRSVEALDTALRRRFSFVEMNPEPEELSKSEFKCDGIDLEKMLKAINARIEKLLDKDYCIGHSYFMGIKNRKEPLEELKNIFHNKILPLLQEYFYGDWGKIMLVVGNEFVRKKEEDVAFLSGDILDDYEEYSEKPVYYFTSPESWTLASFQSIYG